MARAPREVTQIDALATDVPPARAAMPTKTARNNRDNKATTYTRCENGATQAIISGNAAPIVKVAADESAAWTGRALALSVIPISSRACVPNASCRISCSATMLAKPGSSPRYSYIIASSSFSSSTFSASDFLSSSRPAFSVSDCELADTYSPAAMDIAPATNPARPDRRMAFCVVFAEATPIIKLLVETIPSFAPETDARSHPVRCDRCVSWCVMHFIAFCSSEDYRGNLRV